MTAYPKNVVGAPLTVESNSLKFTVQICPAARTPPADRPDPTAVGLASVAVLMSIRLPVRGKSETTSGPELVKVDKVGVTVPPVLNSTEVLKLMLAISIPDWYGDD